MRDSEVVVVMTDDYALSTSHAISRLALGSLQKLIPHRQAFTEPRMALSILRNGKRMLARVLDAKHEFRGDF